MLLLWLDLESHKWSLALDTSPPLSTLWNTELVVSPIWKISPVPLKVWTVAPRISLHCWAQEFHQHLDVGSIEIRQWQVPWHSPLARHADWRVHTSASACDLGAVAWCHPAIFQEHRHFLSRRSWYDESLHFRQRYPELHEPAAPFPK